MDAADLISHRKPVIEHINELRSRFYWVFAALILGTVVGYIYNPVLLVWLVKPLNQPLFYNSPAGGFNFTIKLSLLLGLLFCIPVFLYHSIRFIEPLMNKRSSLLIFGLLISSCSLLVMGITFAYFISLPAALHFLSNFTSSQVQSLISTDQYFVFIARYLLGFGILFQLPIILLILNKLYALEVHSLMKLQRVVIVISLIAAAILTPTPDFINQFMLALPIIFLYQISILLIWLVNKRRLK